MVGLLIALCCTAIGVIALKWRNTMRLRADKVMLDAVDDMYKHFDTLIDAKTAVDQDVPDEVMNLAVFMVKCARMRNVEFILAASLGDSEGDRSGKTPKLASTMREPLSGAFEHMVHAWFRYVSNKNLLARHLISVSIGKKTVRDENFQPFNAQVVRNFAKRKDPSPSGQFAV
jgi:hypothetical protein